MKETGSSSGMETSFSPLSVIPLIERSVARQYLIGQLSGVPNGRASPRQVECADAVQCAPLWQGRDLLQLRGSGAT